MTISLKNEHTWNAYNSRTRVKTLGAILDFPFAVKIFQLQQNISIATKCFNCNKIFQLQQITSIASSSNTFDIVTSRIN